MSMNFLREMTVDAFAKVRSIFRSNFARRKIELELPAHAFERAVDGEGGRDVAEEYLIKALESFLRKYDQKTENIVALFDKAKSNRTAECTFRYAVDGTFLNFPTVIRPDGSNKFKFTIKTVMVKEKFKNYKNDIVINL